MLDGENLPSAALTEQLEQRAIFSLVGDPSGLTVLDVGCGDGVYAVEVSQRGGKVFGLDRSLPMLEAARTRTISSGAASGGARVRPNPCPFSTPRLTWSSRSRRCAGFQNRSWLSRR